MPETLAFNSGELQAHGSHSMGTPCRNSRKGWALAPANSARDLLCSLKTKPQSKGLGRTPPSSNLYNLGWSGCF